MSRTRTSITELQTQRDNLQHRFELIEKEVIDKGLECTSPLEHPLRHDQARIAKKIMLIDEQILNTIDEPHEAAGTHDDPVRYTHNASTPEGRRRENKANWDAAEKDAKAGKVLCLSDLICSAEAVHIDQNKEGE